MKSAERGEEVVRLVDEMKQRGGSHVDIHTSDVKDYNNEQEFLHDSGSFKTDTTRSNTAIIVFGS